MVEFITQGMRANVVALVAHGKVSHEDYEKVVIPAVEEGIKLHSKIRLIFHLGDDFTGYFAEAVWDDAKIGLNHLTAFEKIAVITDSPLIKGAVRVFKIVVPCPVQIFPNQELETATAWIND
jgi:hypothetical protein